MLNELMGLLLGAIGVMILGLFSYCMALPFLALHKYVWKKEKE